MKSRKMVQMNWYVWQKQSHIWTSDLQKCMIINLCCLKSQKKKKRNRITDVENKCMDTKGGKGEWDELGDWD